MAKPRLEKVGALFHLFSDGIYRKEGVPILTHPRLAARRVQGGGAYPPGGRPQGSPLPTRFVTDPILSIQNSKLIIPDSKYYTRHRFVADAGCNIQSGAGGSRTLVQTGKPCAFYTLIPVCVFVRRQDPDHQPSPYPLCFRRTAEAPVRLFPTCCTAISGGFGTGVPERCLVLLPCKRIKPLTYCASVRQRERSCFRQINLMTADI